MHACTRLPPAPPPPLLSGRVCALGGAAAARLCTALPPLVGRSHRPAHRRHAREALRAELAWAAPLCVGCCRVPPAPPELRPLSCCALCLPLVERSHPRRPSLPLILRAASPQTPVAGEERPNPGDKAFAAFHQVRSHSRSTACRNMPPTLASTGRALAPFARLSRPLIVRRSSPPRALFPPPRASVAFTSRFSAAVLATGAARCSAQGRSRASSS